jgi:hypothetical protein
MLSHAKTEMDVVKELAADDGISLLNAEWFLSFIRNYSAGAKLGFKLI